MQFGDGVPKSGQSAVLHTLLFLPLLDLVAQVLNGQLERGE